MRRTMKGILASMLALSMLSTQALTASAYSSIPMYQWTNSPVFFGKTTVFVSDEDNPLKGFISHEAYVSKIVFRTDMENVTAEALGLPEGAEITHPGRHSFFSAKNSYIYYDESYSVTILTKRG